MARDGHGNMQPHAAAGRRLCAASARRTNGATRKYGRPRRVCLYIHFGGQHPLPLAPVGRETGLEPATACLEGRNSTRLSYSRTLSSIPAHGGRVYTPAS